MNMGHNLFGKNIERLFWKYAQIWRDILIRTYYWRIRYESLHWTFVDTCAITQRLQFINFWLGSFPSSFLAEKINRLDSSHLKKYHSNARSLYSEFALECKALPYNSYIPPQTCNKVKIPKQKFRSQKET